MACADPPAPPPLPSGAASTAIYVAWRGPEAPPTQPVATIRARRGSVLDRVVADPDVTTVLNDRFHPVYVVSDADTVQFATVGGCPLTLPLAIHDAGAFIDVANLVLISTHVRNENSPSGAAGCPGAPRYTPASE